MSTTIERPWLSEIEIQELSGYKKGLCQQRALAEMGIDFRRRWDGVTIVLRSALGAYEDSPATNRSPSPGPDMSAI